MTRTEFHVGSRRQKCRTARAKPRRGLSAKRTEFHVGSRRQKCRTARAKPRRGLSAKPNTKLSLFTDEYIIFKVCLNCLVTHLFIFVLLGIADLTGPLYGSFMEKCHTHLMMIHIINKYASKIILHASSLSSKLIIVGILIFIRVRHFLVT